MVFCASNQIPSHEELWEIGIMFHKIFTSVETHPILLIVHHCILLLR